MAIKSREVTQQEVRDFFSKYVFGFMFSDIQREINLARSGVGGGNFLAALGLLCYTEFMGAVQNCNEPTPRKEDKGKFDLFFDALGSQYDALNKKINAYDIFRCGMAHEYFVKKSCTIAMLDKGAPCGIVRDPDGHYYFVVEKYFEDFRAACRRLYQRLMAAPNPKLPA